MEVKGEQNLFLMFDNLFVIIIVVTLCKLLLLWIRRSELSVTDVCTNHESRKAFFMIYEFEGKNLIIH